MTARPSSKLKSGAAWVTPAFGDFDDFLQDAPSTSQKQNQSRKRPREKEQTSKPNDGHTYSEDLASVDTTLWAEKYAPKTADELAVNKKKVQEVQGWLEHSLKAKSKKAPMLLLTGPSGTGKTATVRALAADLQCEVQEWINPVAQQYDDSLAAWADKRDFAAVGLSSYETQATQFQEFLLRANRYPTLQIFQQHQLHKKLILVEDFPNQFFRDTTQFHAILRNYYDRGQCPMLFIISDSAGGESNERHLFPKDLQAELNFANISFNPVAQTSLVKALGKIAAIEESKSKKCGKLEVPDKAEFERLALCSAGDIRAAINALQFTCLRGSQPSTTVFHKSKVAKSKTSSSKGKVKGKKGEGRKNKKAATGDSKEELAHIGDKDTSLFLFHALGKILYCKRGDPNEQEEEAPALPSHLHEHYRDPLLIHPEDVLEKTQLSSDFFTAYLHGNYLEFYSSIEDVVHASEYMSDADYLTIDWASRATLKDYASSVAARGVMFCNTARAKSSTKGSGLGFKPLHKPQWFSICKQARENVSAGKHLFKGKCPPLDLQTQMVPYMAILRPQISAGQKMFVSEVGRLQKFRRKSNFERLDEKDVSEFGEASESQDSAQTINTPLPVNSNDNLEEDEGEGQVSEDEEVIIDDFDD